MDTRRVLEIAEVAAGRAAGLVASDLATPERQRGLKTKRGLLRLDTPATHA